MYVLLTTDRSGWYKRVERNGWRLVSDQLIQYYTRALDPVYVETSEKKTTFHHNRVITCSSWLRALRMPTHELWPSACSSPHTERQSVLLERRPVSSREVGRTVRLYIGTVHYNYGLNINNCWSVFSSKHSDRWYYFGTAADIRATQSRMVSSFHNPDGKGLKELNSVEKVNVTWLGIPIPGSQIFFSIPKSWD